MTGPSAAQSSLDCLRRPLKRLIRAFEYRNTYDSIPDSFRIHSEFIALSHNEATKNDVAGSGYRGYRNGGGACESSPKGKEGTSIKSLSSKVGEQGSRTQLDGYG
jgi:hypothetical protein